ncbi:hypothetical protein ACIBPB_03115 [Micromonospora sp. NPDC049836]|uniref:hypothetical protein n=1 Tax=Micromonospora sp. NPDC049836 TaxID=3364274 RepID=UPI00379DCB60
MLAVAFTPPLWATTLRSLRRLTRMAATALVLAVGLNGLAAAPAGADPVRPAATSRPVADLRLAPAGPDLRTVRYAAAVDSAGPGTATPATGALVPGANAAARDLRATSAGPAVRVPAHRSTPEVASPPAQAGPAVPPTDPGRSTVARRGPPRA